LSQRETFHIRSLNDQIVCSEADAPLLIRVAMPSVPTGHASTEGPLANPVRLREYVRLDALPRELAERVKTALEALSWG
jgi:hypothetical protein